MTIFFYIITVTVFCYGMLMGVLNSNTTQILGTLVICGLLLAVGTALHRQKMMDVNLQRIADKLCEGDEKQANVEEQA